MPQVICRCGGAVCIDFQLLRPYQRLWDDLEGQIRERCGQGLSLRQTKAELDGILASSVGLRKINEVIHVLAHLAPGQQEAERTDIPPVVRLDGLWIKMMEATGEEKEDRLGRLRAVKAGVSRPVLVAQGVWPAMGRQEILTWQLEEDEGRQSWQNLLDHLDRLGVAADNRLQLLIGDGSPGLQSAWQAEVQTSSLRVRMRSALCCLSPRASDEFFLLVPRLPSWPQGRWGAPLSLLLLFFSTPFLLPFEHYSHMLRGAPNRTNSRVGGQRVTDQRHFSNRPPPNDA
jgi:hypothetical protein